MDEDKLQQGHGGDSTGAVTTERVLKIHEVTPNETAYYEEAQGLRDARVRYAQAFQIAKAQGGTDELAHQRAIEMTNDEITLRQALLRIAEERLIR